MNTIYSLQKLREQRPLVHCITNYVAMNIAANTLLSVGASPAMIHAPEETEDFVKLAGALTVNIGTISSSWLEGMKRAAKTAKHEGIPWVLDPVAHFATPYRFQATKELLALKPALIRGNASEILALENGKSSASGVDAKDTVALAENDARKLAESSGAIVIVTGEVDFITDGKQDTRIGGGSAQMGLVTAIGCSLTCLVGAFAAITDPYDAAVNALLLFSEAGNQAEKISNGPGTFLPAFLDALYQISPAELAQTNWIQ